MNCLIVDDDKFSRNVLAKLSEKNKALNLVESCSSAMEAIELLKQEAIDLIFLDIEMPEMSGFELLDSIKEPPQIIVVSGKSEMASDAFSYEVTDFLVKPVELPRFVQAVERAQKEYDRIHRQRRNTDWLFVKKNEVLQKIATRSISSIEAMADYVTIYTESGKYVGHSTMHNMLTMLPEDNFIRVHRSHIISIEKLEEIEGKTAKVGDRFVPIGTTYYSRLMQRLNLV